MHEAAMLPDIRTAVDGVDAMQVVAAEKPDLVVSGCMMPRMDGAGFVRALKAIPALAAIPIVMMSAATL
jgi:CheY-like chemotaxis protein